MSYPTALTRRFAASTLASGEMRSVQCNMFPQGVNLEVIRGGERVTLNLRRFGAISIAWHCWYRQSLLPGQVLTIETLELRGVHASAKKLSVCGESYA